MSEYHLKEIHQPIGYIDLSQTYSVQPVPEISEFVFSISTPSRTYLLKAETAHQVSTWISGLKRLKGKDEDNYWIRKLQNNVKKNIIFLVPFFPNSSKFFGIIFFLVREKDIFINEEVVSKHGRKDGW